MAGSQTLAGAASTGPRQQSAAVCERKGGCETLQPLRILGPTGLKPFIHTFICCVRFLRHASQQNTIFTHSAVISTAAPSELQLLGAQGSVTCCVEPSKANMHLSGLREGCGHQTHLSGRMSLVLHWQAAFPSVHQEM